MLSEFLEASDSDISTRWLDAMPGLRVCCFKLDHAAGGFPLSIPLQLEHLHFEALFFRSGSMALSQGDKRLSVEGWDILLLSDCSQLSSMEFSAPSQGILVSVDGSRAGESLEMLTRLLGRLKLRTSELKARMTERGGCALLKAAPWSRSVFAALDAMPPERRPMYCVLKALELLYLLCAESPLLAENSSSGQPGGYLARIVTDMRVYMEGHLGEKLTIEAMSRRFNISPTAFKSCFKSLYGQPVHRWLQSMRMKKAAELLRSSHMGVLQIAQSVGYEGLSQFNVIFKRQFGLTPRQYKKMSKSA